MKLLIPRVVWLQMLCYAKNSLPNEVTGIGVIEPVQDPDGYTRSFRAIEVRIAPQKVSSGYCEFEDEALHGVYADFAEAGRAEDISKLRFRWHSHGAGQVFFSSTDTKDIDENKLSADWVVSLVINVDGKHIARLDNYYPFRNSVPLEVEIYDDLPEGMLDQCKAELKNCVSLLPEPAPTYADKLFEKGGEGECETSLIRRGSLIR